MLPDALVAPAEYTPNLLVCKEGGVHAAQGRFFISEADFECEDK